MAKTTWLRSHVERCLQDIWDVRRVKPDSDGDYRYRFGTAACWVGIDAHLRPVTVTATAHAAVGVPWSSKLMREINQVNTASRLASVVWCDQLVVVKQSILATGADRHQLRHVCAAVGSVAEDVGAMIASVYGGATPFPAEEAETADGECA